MPATFIRLGYGVPISGVYPSFVDLAYPAWQLKGGVGPLIRNGRRLSKTPVAGGTLVQGLGRIAQEHEIDLLYRPRLREVAAGLTPPVWDEILETIEDELLEQECSLYWGDRLRGRFLLADYSWSPRDMRAIRPIPTSPTAGSSAARLTCT